jgi:NADH dehydrogenase FAD-containing subunit
VSAIAVGYFTLVIIVATSKFDADESSKSSSISSPKVKGLLAFMLWRAAYWTKQVSLQNKMLILMYWFKSAVFGRDVSRF